MDGDPRPELDSEATGGFGIRFLGRLIDTVAVTACGGAAGAVGGFTLAVLAELGLISVGWEHRVGTGGLLVQLAWGSTATLAYHTLAEGIAGTSLGKLLVGYRVISLEEITPCEPKAALIRSLGYFVDAQFFGIPAGSSMSATAYRQRYGDRWAGTAVVKASALPPKAKRTGALLVAGLLAGLLSSGVINLTGLIVRGL